MRIRTCCHRAACSLASALALLAFGTQAGANDAPVVSNVVATVDLEQASVVVTFDLADTEDDALQVDVRVSTDGGITFDAPGGSLQGDHGFPVDAGEDKRIVWQYDPATAAGGREHRVQVLADDLQPLDVAGLIAGVDQARMAADIAALEGVRHYATGLAHMETSKDYIEAEMAAVGLRTTRQPFTHRGWAAENVIGTLPGELVPQSVLIIDGHFDTISSSPGADDNASGTAGMLEAARVLSAYRFYKSVRFIGFDLEEVGLIGSQRYVASGIPEGEIIDAVFNFEMIGYTCETPGCDDFGPVGNYIHNISDPASNGLRFAFDNAASIFVPELAIVSTEATPTNPNFRRSDHARFWDAGIPALFLTDGANFRNPHYHRGTDRLSTLDLEFAANVVKATLATVAAIAGPRHSGAAVSEPFVIGETPVTPTTWGSMKARYR